MTDTNQDKILQLAKDMNDALGLYLPADVLDEPEQELYDRFFVTLRMAFYEFAVLSQEEITQYFVEFYNGDYFQKRQLYNVVVNEINTRVRYDAIEAYIDVEKQQGDRFEIYSQLDSVDSKAAFLFTMYNKITPRLEDDLSEYYEQVKIIDAELKRIEELEDQQDQISAREELAQEIEDIKPEDVVSRYLKGSGVYDPALRNTGFRIDTDIEGINKPEV
jgi:hypothetical protein